MGVDAGDTSIGARRWHDERMDLPKTVVDPVCGMTIDPAKAAGTWEYEGQRYYFCNPKCQTRFQADPDSFLERAAPSALHL